MDLILIRHGCTKGNLEHRYVGTTEEGLTEDAVRQIKANRDCYPEPDILFVSPLGRCRETASLLYPGIRQEIIPDLRECAFGAFEYKNYLELQGNAEYQAWIDSGGILAFPGGESRKAFIDRCSNGFLTGYRTALQRKCEKAAFVVHGGTIMAVLHRYSSPHKDYFEWQVKNAQGYVGKTQEKEGQLLITELQKIETGV